MIIKNVVFDVGNVLVRWDPPAIIRSAFPDHEDPAALAQQFFKSQWWFDLNLGRISEEELLAKYQKYSGFEISQLQRMALIARESLVVLPESVTLLKNLHQAQFNLFALTDNTHEFMKHLKKTYDFWPLFQGVVVSAEVGMMKPHPEIYRHLLSTYTLDPSETVFIDDYLSNVEGAKAVGIHAIHFQDAPQCLQELKALGVAI